MRDVERAPCPDPVARLDPLLRKLGAVLVPYSVPDAVAALLVLLRNELHRGDADSLHHMGGLDVLDEEVETLLCGLLDAMARYGAPPLHRGGS